MIGAPNSSNSKRLVEVGEGAGCTYAQLVQRAADIDWRAIEGVARVGVTAGASAPEVLVNEVIDAFRDRYDLAVEMVETAVENVEFKVPRVLRERGMNTIPRAPLLLGLAGLLPFLWGVLTLHSEEAARLTLDTVGPRFTGPFVMLQYGTIILAFMSGVLWGFATKAQGAVAASGYALFGRTGALGVLLCRRRAGLGRIYLIAGFVGLLGLDWMFWRQGLAPDCVDAAAAPAHGGGRGLPRNRGDLMLTLHSMRRRAIPTRCGFFWRCSGGPTGTWASNISRRSSTGPMPRVSCHFPACRCSNSTTARACPNRTRSCVIWPRAPTGFPATPWRGRGCSAGSSGSRTSTRA